MTVGMTVCVCVCACACKVNWAASQADAIFGSMVRAEGDSSPVALKSSLQTSATAGRSLGSFNGWFGQSIST